MKIPQHLDLENLRFSQENTNQLLISTRFGEVSLFCNMLSLVEESNLMFIKINLNKALQRLNF